MEYRAMRRSFVSGWHVLAFALTVAGTPVSVFAQNGQTVPNPQVPTTPPPAVRRLTIEEAVKLSLENNLGVQVARIDPQVQDYTVAQARANWAPTLTSNVATNSNTQVSSSVLAGG